MGLWGNSEEIARDGVSCARIVGVNREIYHLGWEDSDVPVRGELTGKLRFQSRPGELPVVGDWVRCIRNEDFCLIEEVLPRRTVISRKSAGAVTEEQPLAANIDLVAIVQGLDGGRNFSLRGMERYLTLAWNSGAVPLIILNKADLNDDADSFLREAEFASPGADVMITSAEKGRGIGELRVRFRDKTAVLVGPSGVGKSALSNALLEREAQQTGANRESDRKGKHTTTSSRLFLLPEGGWLIDSPGLKEIQLWGNEQGVEDTFGEIDELAGQCRFSDCRHEGEPGCAVMEALREGKLDQNRYASYLELRREMDWLDSRRSEKGRLDERKKGKTLSKTIKNMKKGKPVY